MTRRSQREKIFSILFRLEFNDIDEMKEQMEYALDSTDNLSDDDRRYITDKTDRIIGLIDDIDAVITEISEGWRFERIGKPELAILRLAIYEMLYDDDIPYKVAINEALELSKVYCNEDARSFINGLLAKVDKRA